MLDTETADCGHLRYRPPVRASGGGREHAALAARVRQALAVLWNTGGRSGAAGYPLMLERARKLANYFGQPFFVAEPCTHRPGTYVGLREALDTCGDILDGRQDDLPTEAFYFAGGIEEIRGRAQAPSAPAASGEIRTDATQP